MPEMREAASEGNLDLTQAMHLALLLEVEARYENLRSAGSVPPGGPSTTQDLHRKQKAYEDFQATLRRYNEQYTPAHVPEVMLNKPDRLGKWCRRIRRVYLRVAQDPQTHYPVHLLEKAYRCADRLAAKLGKDPVCHTTSLSTIGTALQDLDALAQWCDDLARGS